MLQEATGPFLTIVNRNDTLCESCSERLPSTTSIFFTQQPRQSWTTFLSCLRFFDFFWWDFPQSSTPEPRIQGNWHPESSLARKRLSSCRGCDSFLVRKGRIWLLEAIEATVLLCSLEKYFEQNDPICGTLYKMTNSSPPPKCVLFELLCTCKNPTL